MCIQHVNKSLSPCMVALVYVVYVCVCEREREGDRERSVCFFRYEITSLILKSISSSFFLFMQARPVLK